MAETTAATKLFVVVPCHNEARAIAATLGIRGRLDCRAAAVRVCVDGVDPARRDDRPGAALARDDEAFGAVELVPASIGGAPSARPPIRARRPPTVRMRGAQPKNWRLSAAAPVGVNVTTREFFIRLAQPRANRRRNSSAPTAPPR